MKENKKSEFKLAKDSEVEKQDDVKELEKPSQEEIVKQEKKKKRRRQIRAIVVFAIMALIALFIAFWWQGWKFDLRGFADAFTLAFVISLLTTWTMFVYNQNILSPLIHGVKTFGLMLVGKKPKQDYYSYMQKVEEEPIPKSVIIYSSIFTLVLGITMTTLILLSLKYPRT